MMHRKPSGSRFLTLYAFFLRDFYRSRAFILMFVLIACIAAVVIMLTFYEYNALFSFIVPTPTAFNHVSPQLRVLILDYLWSYIGVLIPPLAASFFSSPAVSGDVENGTIIPLLTLPVSRDRILFSKMLASFTAIAMSMTLYEVVQLLAISARNMEPPPSVFILSYGLMLVFIFSCNSMAFAIGSFFRKGAHSTIVYLMLFYIVFNVISITLLFGLNAVPLYILNNAGGIANRVFVDLNPALFYGGGSISGARMPEILYSIEIMLLYSVAFTLISYLAFTRARRTL